MHNIYVPDLKSGKIFDEKGKNIFSLDLHFVGILGDFGLVCSTLYVHIPQLDELETLWQRHPKFVRQPIGLW